MRTKATWAYVKFTVQDPPLVAGIQYQYIYPVYQSKVYDLKNQFIQTATSVVAAGTGTCLLTQAITNEWGGWKQM